MIFFSKSILLVSIYLNMLCCVCFAVESNDKEKTMPNEQQHGYYYEMSQQKLAELIENIRKVEIGDSAVKVISTLGKADYDRTGYSKDRRRRFLCRTLSYYVKKWTEGFVNEKYDRFVDLDFDDKDNLFRIVSNVEGIPSRGEKLISTWDEASMSWKPIEKQEQKKMLQQ